MGSDSICRIDDLADVLLALVAKVAALESDNADLREKLNETDPAKRF